MITYEEYLDGLRDAKDPNHAEALSIREQKRSGLTWSDIERHALLQKIEENTRP